MKRILVAGIGNIFFGDDAFGCEVAAALAARPQPAGVHAEDFGIRSYDLVYALMECEVAILIDAVPSRGAPGTLSLLQPDVENSPVEPVDAHSLDPVRLLQTARSLGGRLPEIYLVGCEPETLEPQAELVLSAPVRAAVPHAVALVESLLRDLLQEPAAASLAPAPA